MHYIRYNNLIYLFIFILSLCTISVSFTVSSSSSLSVPTPSTLSSAAGYLPICGIVYDGATYSMGYIQKQGTISLLSPLPSSWSNLLNSGDIAIITNLTYFITPRNSNIQPQNNYGIVTIESPTKATIVPEQLETIPGYKTTPSILQAHYDNKRDTILTLVTGINNTYTILVEVAINNNTITHIWSNFQSYWNELAWIKYDISYYDNLNQQYIMIGSTSNNIHNESLLIIPYFTAKPLQNIPIPENTDILALNMWNNSYIVLATNTLTMGVELLGYSIENQQWYSIYQYNGMYSFDFIQVLLIDPIKNILITMVTNQGESVISYIDLIKQSEIYEISYSNSGYSIIDIALCEGI